MKIFDIDGTLTEVADLASHCMGTATKDEILRVMDPVVIAKLRPRLGIIYEVRKHSRNRELIVLITGRWQYLESVTRAWLMAYDVPYDLLAMRRSEDWKLTSVDVKMAAYHSLVDGLRKSGSRDFFKGDSETEWWDDDPEMIKRINQYNVKGRLVQ